MRMSSKREDNQIDSMWSFSSFFKYRVWLYSPGWPLICDPLASAFQGLGLLECATRPSKI